MTAEEAIKDLQNKKPPTKEELRRSRTIAVVLASFLIIALLAVVYAFVQQTIAKKQETIANQIMKKNMQLEERLRISMEETNRQRMIAEEQRLIAIKALEDCKSSKKKK